ncbi:gliding motility-associated C-terminal domain-containing protein [Labilibaculum filiforme]|nr:gliding motility-associated C-terminal domain-containing protein [Labilibaculum filiforme]
MKRFLQLIYVTIVIGISSYSGVSQILRPVNDTTICVGESVVLEAQSGSYMYNWSTGQLSPKISVSPVVTTTYNLRVFIPDTGTELITNGDFDFGNTGINSEYIYCPDPVLSSASHSNTQSLWMEGRYAVDSNPQAYHANFSSCNGHSGNSPDKMLIVNGAPDENVVVWSQTITVVPNQYYAFSTWASNVHPTNPARLEFMIDGILMGDYIEPSAGLTCNWEEFYSLWYSGTKTSIKISIVNKNLIRSGNDYALDGISFNPLVEVPDSRTITVLEPAIVDAGADIAICGNEVANLSAVVSNQTGFLWSTSGDGSFSNSSNINSTYTPGSNDVANGSVQLTATANSNSPCGTVSDFLTLTLNPIPFVGFGDNQASCDGGNVILDAQNSGSSYSWNTGETSQTIEVSTAGTYSVEVINAFNCVVTDTVYVGFYENLSIDLGPDRIVCSGEPVVLNAGISGATYLWSTGENTQEIIVYNDGNYSVTVTNSYGCNATDDINVTLVPPPVVDLGPDQVLNTGDVIRLDAGSHYFYVWDDGSRNRYLDVDKPGLYAVRVYDRNGCSAMDMVNIISATGTVPDVTLNDTIICRDESVELYAGNDFLFNWDVDGLSSRVVVSPDSTTTYHLRVFYVDETLELVENGDFTLGRTNFESDYYYCSYARWCRSRSSKYTVSSNTEYFGSDKSDCSGVTGNSSDQMMVIEGGGVNTTVWEQDIDVDADSYYVFALNITNLKSDSFDDFELVINGVVIERFSTNSPCNWDKYQRLVYSDTSNSLNIQINNVSTSGSNNAFALDGISMYKLSEIPLDVTVEVIQHVTADAGPDLAICELGTASLSGGVTNESSFTWRSFGDGSFDNTGILNPNYTPGSADVLNGYVDLELSAQPIIPCVMPALDTVRVDINSNLNVNLGIDQEICEGNTITLDAGNAGGTYLWNTGETTQTIIVNTTGTYSVTVTDVNGCSGTDDIDITVHANPIVDLGADQEECNGNNIMFDAGHPGSTYLWSTGETIQGILVTTSGNYSVVMTDANGCSATDDVNATIHANPLVDLGIDQEICAGNSITFDAGNTGATYLWSTGATTQTITVATSGNYSVTITDANGCTATDDANATIHANPVVDLGIDQSTCAGGTITFDAGNVGATYLWSTGETTQTISVSTSGNYSVTITDANGCSATDDANATIHANPVVDLGIDQEICAGNSITFDAGNIGATYLWSTGETTQTITVATSGNYSVTITDANGCTATDDANATIHANPTVNLGADQEVCAGGTITFDAGNIGATYLWSTGETTQAITVATSGNYSVTITDANGCTATDDANATIHANPVVDLGIDQETCAGNSITFDAGNTGATYLWSTGETTQTITVATSGNYGVTITDANGCSATDDANATIHANPVVDLGIDQETCAGGTITFDAGNTGATYLWSTGATTQTITVATSGNYSVTITDANGCSATDDANATIHANPLVDLGIDQSTCAGGTITFDAGNAGATYLWSTGATTQTITVATSGNYSVTITDANGCTATDDANATIHVNPLVDLGIDQSTCAGGTITFDAGNAGATYLWPTGETTQTITVATSGNYSVTITDANGCSATDDVNATIHVNPVVDLGIDQETCAGGTITFDAGNAGATYLWSTGETTQTITVATSGNYSVAITDANGCTATDDANATIHANPTVNLGADQEICAGGTITFDAGNAGATYLWNTGETTQTIIVNTTGTYSVTVTDVNGCSGTDDIDITVHANPIVDLGADQEECNGNNIMFDAGHPGSTYLWSTGETTQTITVAISGNYSVTITDANGCIATDDANATIHANPTVDLGIDQETCAGGTITFDAGNAGATYLWSTGETTQTITVATSGNYSVTITDANGCTATDDANATIHANPLVDLGIDQSTCAGNSITFDAGNAGATYLWSTGETTQTITVATSGNYSVTITDANGCSATDDADATIHANPVVDLGIDQETCAGGTITFDAENAGATYVWSTGETTQAITVATSGNYLVTITDANGCSATDDANAIIHANPIVNLGSDQETCAGGTITFDAGNAGATYLWSTGETTQTITVSVSGNYSVTITDANGCTATGDANATIHANPLVDLGIDQEICAGGTITFDAGNIGATYLWSTGETTQTITVATSGNYSVTITDANGCTATDDANATIHANPTVNLGADQEVCAGGTITFDAGNVGSTYLWSTGETTQAITVATSGNYSVTITDANGCSATDDVNATIHANPLVDLGIDQSTCAGNSITFDAGNAGATYLWSTGATTQTITVATSGNYSVTITDANGCTATDDANAMIHANPTVDLGIDQETCAGNSITFDAGNIGATYLWSTGETTQTITVATSGTYSVTITDANGCSATDDANATIHANPIVDLGIDQSTCAGNSITFDAGNAGATYLWSTGETTQTITVATSGNYSVTITDANGCTATDDANATIHANPTVNLGADQEICAGGTITFDAGNIGATYLWSTGETTQTITVATSGNYSVTITDANGCTATDDANATIHANPTVNLGADQEICAGGTITFDAGNIGATYLWSTGETTQTITVATSGNYSVTITDANGCTATDDANATIHANPTVDLGIDQETCAGNTITFDAGNIGATYLWSTGETTQTITVATSGNYSVTITDANGCTATDDANATIHANPLVDLGIDQSTCAGNSITFDAENVGATYLWSTGETTQTITVATSGNYSVTITDANGCSATDDANATIHANPLVDLGIDQETCAGNTITFDAGNIGATYLWSTGATTQTITVSASGNYSVSITDANGCTATDDANATIHANPLVDLGIDQSTCAGNSITFDAGNTGATYLWSTGETTQTITVATSGNYSVTITDANGCSATDDANATIHANPVVDLGIDQSTCAGGTITFDAGNIGATYLWSTGATTQTISVSTSGNYSVTITDANGCSATDDANATIHANPLVDLGIDQETCAGNSITFDAGNIGATCLWSTGATTQTITVATSGNYSVTITDANGCTATDDVNATIHANPTVNLGADQEVCAGGTITFDAGNIGATYLWSTGATTQTISVTTSGNYSVTITDANGCTATDDANATIHANPTVDLGIDQSTCAGNSITFDAGNIGATYLWSTGATTQTISVSTSGNYSVTITDANGCSATDDANATIHANPLVDLGIDQSTCAGNSITFDAENAGATYVWSTGETTQTITVATSGNYSVTITDANGCTATDDANATIHANPTVDLGADQSYCDEDLIVLDAGVQIGSYLWNTGETTHTITVSEAKTYSVNFTDANGCTAIDSINVEFYPSFNFKLSYSSNLVCYGDSTHIEGPIQAGYSYQWNKDGTQLVGETNYSIKAGDTGWYTLNIINENGCFASDSIHVEIIHLPNNPLPSQIDMCFGESVLLDIGDGESFLWNDGITTQTRLAYNSGVYSVEVHDSHGCIGYDSVSVTVHDLPLVDLGPDLYICEGEELIIEAPVGYQTEWIPGGQTKEIYVYEDGAYTLKATDEFGCVGLDEIKIFVHDNPEVYLGRDTVIAEGTTLLLDAGSGYVQYEWNNQESSQFLKVNRDGEYAVNVIDVHGCRGNGKVKVAVNPVPSINLGGSAGICQGTSLMLDPGHWERYSWSTGETTRTINVNKTGDYIVSVWDVYGIMGIDTLHVEVYPSPEINLTADTLSFYKGQSVTIDAGSGYSSYYWSTGSDWRSIEVDQAGDYSIQVTNSYGCIAQSTAAVKLLQPKMVVPNVFTPNGKGPNEIFYPVFKGVVTDFELYIYSRWGEQLFELRRDVVSNNELKYDGWNGTYKGEDAEIGVYVWMIFYGGKERAHGTVTLFR